MSDRASISNIIKLSIPIFFANLVIPLVAIVDTGLMGNLDNASYLTATSIATSVFSLIFWSFGFLRMGTVGLVAQAHGSNQYEEIVNLVFSKYCFCYYYFLTFSYLSKLYFYNFFNTWFKFIKCKCTSELICSYSKSRWSASSNNHALI